MAQTNFEVKEQSLTDTPLLVFDCILRNGQTERWSTHQATLNGHPYAARVLQHNLFAMETASQLGLDVIPKISLTLANADSHFSQIERATGFKGAKITVSFLFYDLRANAPVTDPMVVFQGIANPPDEIREATLRLTAINRMSMQRVLLPQVRIQRRCPWDFPATGDQRAEAVDGGAAGRYSRFFRCGYSPDVAGGRGNLNGAAPFTSCAYTRADCIARGMFSEDSSARATSRFGGVEFVPPQIQVRTYGDKSWHASPVTENEALYNDFVPVVYGTAWYYPPIVFARNDGNLTRMEVLLGIGEITGVLKVLVNGIEIPLGQAGVNMTGTGWFSLVTPGTRTGGFDLEFTDGAGNAAGDPYGSLAYLSLVVPNRINDGTSLPSVQVLVQGLKLPVYGSDGSYQGDQFTNNPAWVLLDILQRSGWTAGEIDLPAFAAAAAWCGQQIEAADLNGNPIQIPRFACNLVLQKRRSAADVIRGIRNGARLYLTYGNGGLLQLGVENTLALQQPAKPAWSNSTEVLNSGWPSYEFGDGTTAFSGILRRANGEPSIRVHARAIADTPNRFAVEFQDELNGYQQDSFDLVDVDDVAASGQEISATLSALGIPNFDQAARISKFNLDRSIRGNTYVEFETSVKGLGLRPGDLISITYEKEGFERQPFRVLAIAPGLNYRTAAIMAQIHDDAWYADTNGRVPGDASLQPGAGIGLPRPLVGDTTDANGDIQFSVVESAQAGGDGSVTLQATVGFIVPNHAQTGAPPIPLLSLAPVIASGGTLAGSQALYYAISAVDASETESALSFIVRAVIPPGPATNSVTLNGLSFAPGVTRFHVYRGANPAQLFRIAADQPVAAGFTDTGLAKQLTGPPDANFDHANFYWRLELQPEYAASLHGADTIGNSSLEMPANLYRGMTVRITRGAGAGQERGVISNTATTLMVTPKWHVVPDATSFFVVAEAGWHFGAAARTSPVEFEIPNRGGAVVEIGGRAANVNDEEAPYELSTVTRWPIGGAGAGDSDVPPAPIFAIQLSSGNPGTIELSGVAFTDLTNTHTATAGSLSLFYWNELGPLTSFSLASALAADDTVISLNAAGAAQPGAMIQIDSEVLQVVAVLNGGTQYEVTRAADSTGAAAHAQGAAIYHLAQYVAIVPFARNFFGSPYSGDWAYPISLPGVRVACAELFLTNNIGAGPSGSISLTQTTDHGLRTLSGGQYSFQVDGFLAVQTGAAPDLIVEAPHAVRDIYAIVRQAPSGGPIAIQLNYNGAAYCTLTIADGATVSNIVKGFGLPFLDGGSRVRMDITAAGADLPGSDLTVIIRL